MVSQIKLTRLQCTISLYGEHDLYLPSPKAVFRMWNQCSDHEGKVPLSMTMSNMVTWAINTHGALMSQQEGKLLLFSNKPKACIYFKYKIII